MLIDTSAPVTNRQLRWFAGLWLPLFLVIAGLSAFRQDARAVAGAIWAVAVVLSVAGLLRPSIVRPVYRGLIWLTFPIGWLLSHALLLTLYYVVITPIGLLVRVFYDPLERAFDRTAASYWSPREQSEPQRYFRQF